MATAPKNTWRPANRGTAVKESDKGLVYLEFNERQVMALRPAPVVAWTKTKSNGRWRGVAAPDIHVGALIRQIRAEDAFAAGISRATFPRCDRPPMRPYEIRRRMNFRRFLDEIPADVQDELAVPHPPNDWAFLRLLVASPHAREMCRAGDRVVAWMMTLAPDLAGISPRRRMEFAARWLARGPRAAMARLGFPDRPLSLRLLRKLNPAHADLEVLTALRSGLRDKETVKALSHLPSVLTAAQVLCAHPRHLPRLDPAFLLELGNAHNRWEANATVRMIVECQVLEEQLASTARVIFSSREILRSHHHALVTKSRRPGHDPNVVFPPPPAVALTVDEASWVRPLTTGHALLAEGKEMNHCLGARTCHHDLAHLGMLHTWALTGNERATIALMKCENDWGIYDARGVGNTDISEDLSRWVTGFVARIQAADDHAPTPINDNQQACSKHVSAREMDEMPF